MTDDEKAGIDWWNSMPEWERRECFDLMGVDTPAEAWHEHKLCMAQLASMRAFVRSVEGD